MTAIGVLQRSQIIFQWRILGYDLFVLGGYICGMLLALNQPAWRMMQFIRLAYLLWLCGLLVDSMLLAFGIIPPVWLGDPRVHVWAEFTCIEGLLLALPYLLHPSLQRGPRLLRGEFLGLIGLIAVFIVNLAMGARSVLIQVVVATLLCLPLYARRLPRTLLYSGVVLLSIGVGVFAQYSPALSQNYAVQRLQQTDVQDEERTVEIGLLLSYIGWHAVFGLGNGSGFPSITVREGEDFAAYPHLSILAPFQKGGIPAMAVFVFSPLAMLLIVLSRRGFSPLQQEAATSALLYLLYSCMSGTWVFPMWVFFGIGVGYCFYGKSSMARQLAASAKIVKAPPCPPLRSPSQNPA